MSSKQELNRGSVGQAQGPRCEAEASGQRQRHRLSLGGERAANNALWTISNNHVIHDARIRDFAEKRREEGDSREDTLRVLKRYIAREIVALIRAALRL